MCFNIIPQYQKFTHHTSKAVKGPAHSSVASQKGHTEATQLSGSTTLTPFAKIIICVFSATFSLSQLQQPHCIFYKQQFYLKLKCRTKTVFVYKILPEMLTFPNIFLQTDSESGIDQ